MVTALKETPAAYVLFGIPEDLGARGKPLIGRDSVWIPFLQSFLNVPKQHFLDGKGNIAPGHFDFGDLNTSLIPTARGRKKRSKPTPCGTNDR